MSDLGGNREFLCRHIIRLNGITRYHSFSSPYKGQIPLSLVVDSVAETFPFLFSSLPTDTTQNDELEEGRPYDLRFFTRQYRLRRNGVDLWTPEETTPLKRWVEIGEDEFGHIEILGRLKGGKGGFGSLLRGQKGGGKRKTTNLDACRDLNGRRLRHARAAERLAAWMEKKRQEDELVRSLCGDDPAAASDRIIQLTVSGQQAASSLADSSLNSLQKSYQQPLKQKAKELNSLMDRGMEAAAHSNDNPSKKESSRRRGEGLISRSLFVPADLLASDSDEERDEYSEDEKEDFVETQDKDAERKSEEGGLRTFADDLLRTAPFADPPCFHVNEVEVDIGKEKGDEIAFNKEEQEVGGKTSVDEEKEVSVNEEEDVDIDFDEESAKDFETNRTIFPSSCISGTMQYFRQKDLKLSSDKKKRRRRPRGQKE